jgi:hypothetical protein
MSSSAVSHSRQLPPRYPYNLLSLGHTWALSSVTFHAFLESNVRDNACVRHLFCARERSFFVVRLANAFSSEMNISNLACGGG